MANNVFKPRGATSASKPDAGGAVLRSVPVFGVVKDNIDPIRSGRLRVYLADIGGQDPDDADSWVSVNYMTPFYGLTENNAPKEGYGTYLQNSSAYGMWNSPPDIGTTVICLFINGDPEYGYWIGCVPEPEALFTVPALGSTETVILNAIEGQSYGGATKLPVSNINSNNEKINESPTFFKEPKPVHSYLAGVLKQQGLIRDTIRGTIGTSAQRESPSRVGWGVNTPGRPIYEGGFTDETIADAAGNEGQQASLKVVSRRAGHSIVMDDGDLIGRDQLIRLRTSLGHQILMSDDGQTLFIIHANGQSYIELGKEGTIDMYATNSVNIRTQGDLNLHADNNINMHAKKDLNIYAENITTNSDKKTSFKIGSDYVTSVQGKYTLKVDGPMAFKSAGEAGFASTNNTFINGAKINLNTGQASTNPEAVSPIPTVAHTDTMYDSTKGWAAAPGALLSITSRAPAHSPWASANQGVDVKVDNSAAANFPSAPAPAVAAANASATTPSSPVTPAVAATIPTTTAISKAVDTNTTNMMVGAVSAKVAGTPDVANAVKTGAGVVTNAAGQKTAVVGQLAQTPEQMEAAGILKPGSAALVARLVQGGMTVEQALTSNLFTGKSGAESLQTYLNNSTSQVQAQVANFQQAQTALTQAGMITGKESAAMLAGPIIATALSGSTNAINAIKAGAGAIGQTITGPINALTGGAANSVLGTASSLLATGSLAGNLASTVTGGLSSIAGSLGGLTKGLTGGLTGLLDSAKGIAGSAFAAITSGFPILKAGVPQNLKQIANEASAIAQNSGTPLEASLKESANAFNISGADASSIASGVASSALNGAAGAAALVATATGATTNLVSSVTGSSTTNLVNSAKSLLPSSVSTGLSGLPGAQNAVASVVNNATNALNIIPGTSAISGALRQVTAAIASGGALGNVASGMLNTLKNPGASLQALASAGLPAGAAAALNSAISSLSSGGSVPIKLPVVGTNTFDRSSINWNVFGSSKIPIPNYGGNPATTGETVSSAAAAMEKSNQRLEKIRELGAQSREKRLDVGRAQVAYAKAIEDLPAGDPGIEAALEKLQAERTALADVTLEMLRA